MEERNGFLFQLWRVFLIAAARAARDRAVSWRGFKVGCAALAVRGEEVKIFSGANIKPAEDGPKVCAEQFAVGSALVAGFNVVVALVIFGEAQPDKQSHLETTTLHPCWVCREFLQPEVGVYPETIIFSIDAVSGKEEQYTFGEILKLHSREHESES